MRHQSVLLTLLDVAAELLPRPLALPLLALANSRRNQVPESLGQLRQERSALQHQAAFPIGVPLGLILLEVEDWRQTPLSKCVQPPPPAGEPTVRDDRPRPIPCFQQPVDQLQSDRPVAVVGRNFGEWGEFG